MKVDNFNIHLVIRDHAPKRIAMLQEKMARLEVERKTLAQEVKYLKRIAKAAGV